MPHDVGLTAMLAIGFASLPTGWACRPWSAILWRASWSALHSDATDAVTQAAARRCGHRRETMPAG